MLAKLPNSLGATIDAIAKVMEQRKALTAKDTELKDQEQILKNHLMANFAKDKIGLDGARGKLGLATIKRSTVPSVKDWDKFYAYISKNKAWDLLQRRPGTTAIAARWAAGKTVAGVEAVELEVLQVSLIKAKK